MDGDIGARPGLNFADYDNDPICDTILSYNYEKYMI